MPVGMRPARPVRTKEPEEIFFCVSGFGKKSQLHKCRPRALPQSAPVQPPRGAAAGLHNGPEGSGRTRMRSLFSRRPRNVRPHGRTRLRLQTLEARANPTAPVLTDVSADWSDGNT